MPPPLPPPLGHELPLIVLPVIFSVVPLLLKRPPPLTAELPLMVLSVTLSVPPCAASPPPLLLATFAVMTQAVTSSCVPFMKMPPPLPETSPLVIVRPEIVAVTPDPTVKMRYCPPVSRRTVKALAPGPVIVMLVLIPGSALPRLIVHGPAPPLQPESVATGILKVIAFVSAATLAAAIASRRLQSLSQTPSLVSAVLVTTWLVGGAIVNETVAVLPSFVPSFAL